MGLVLVGRAVPDAVNPGREDSGMRSSGESTIGSVSRQRFLLWGSFESAMFMRNSQQRAAILEICRSSIISPYVFFTNKGVKLKC